MPADIVRIEVHVVGVIWIVRIKRIRATVADGTSIVVNDNAILFQIMILNVLFLLSDSIMKCSLVIADSPLYE